MLSLWTAFKIALKRNAFRYPFYAFTLHPSQWRWLFIWCFGSPVGSHRTALRSALKSQHYNLVLELVPAQILFLINVAHCFSKVTKFFTDGNKIFMFLYLQTLWFTTTDKFFCSASGHGVIILSASHLPFVPLRWVLAGEVQALGFVAYLAICRVLMTFPVLLDSSCHPEHRLAGFQRLPPPHPILSQETKAKWGEWPKLMANSYWEEKMAKYSLNHVPWAWDNWSAGYWLANFH